MNINNKDINTVAIATRHNSHAYFVERVLSAGKNVFVEKPLALTVEEIEKIETVYNQNIQTNPKSPENKLDLGANLLARKTS